jgi:hypothetical protein
MNTICAQQRTTRTHFAVRFKPGEPVKNLSKLKLWQLRNMDASGLWLVRFGLRFIVPRSRVKWLQFINDEMYSAAGPQPIRVNEMKPQRRDDRRETPSVFFSAFSASLRCNSLPRFAQGAKTLAIVVRNTRKALSDCYDFRVFRVLKSLCSLCSLRLVHCFDLVLATQVRISAFFGPLAFGIRI